MNKNTMMITTEKERTVLARLTGPMTFGILGMIVFNLMDTFYVGRLGTVELAALSFTFPVVLVISSIAHGLGVGMTAAVFKAAGKQDREKQVRLITHGMVLSFLVVCFFVLLGQLTINPVFRLLGADEETLPVIREYMSIWYWGVIFVVIPMTGNSAIRGMGDTKTPSMVMLVAAVMNTILDPLLIFGVGPFPRMGVTGAALATVCSRALTFVVASYILICREKVISLRHRSISHIWESWKEILHVGVPNALTKMIIPLASGIITGMIAVHGREAVAGFGVATRLDMFALILINALISVLPVFIGQNWGAGKKDRVLRGIRVSSQFALIYGAGMYLLLALAARPIGFLFNDNPLVVDVIVRYLRIVPLAYGMQGIMLVSVTSLNVLKRPVHAAVFTLIQMFGFYVPLAVAGSRLIGVSGIFGALALSYLVMGPLAHALTRKYIKGLSVQKGAGRPEKDRPIQ